MSDLKDSIRNQLSSRLNIKGLNADAILMLVAQCIKSCKIIAEDCLHEDPVDEFIEEMSIRAMLDQTEHLTKESKDTNEKKKSK